MGMRSAKKKRTDVTMLSATVTPTPALTEDLASARSPAELCVEPYRPLLLLPESESEPEPEPLPEPLGHEEE